MKTFFIVALAIIITTILIRMFLRHTLKIKANKELEKMMKAFDDNNWVKKELERNKQNLHSVYNKNVKRGKDGRFVSKNDNK